MYWRQRPGIWHSPRFQACSLCLSDLSDPMCFQARGCMLVSSSFTLSRDVYLNLLKYWKVESWFQVWRIVLRCSLVFCSILGWANYDTLWASNYCIGYDTRRPSWHEWIGCCLHEIVSCVTWHDIKVSIRCYTLISALWTYKFLTTIIADLNVCIHDSSHTFRPTWVQVLLIKKQNHYYTRRQIVLQNWCNFTYTKYICIFLYINIYCLQPKHIGYLFLYN